MVVTGGRKNFAAGADISEFPSFTAETAQQFSNMFNDSLLALENLPQVTISAINGFALGGGLEVAVATDFRMIAEDGRMGVPEIQLGLIPGGGGTQRLARLAGVTMAKDMVYSGRHVGAEEALANKIVSSIHDPDELQDAAIAKAAEYATGPAALRMAKRAILDGLALPLMRPSRSKPNSSAPVSPPTTAAPACRASWRTVPARPRSPAAARHRQHGPATAGWVSRSPSAGAAVHREGVRRRQCRDTRSRRSVSRCRALR